MFTSTNRHGAGYVYIYGGSGTYKIGKAKDVRSRLANITLPPFPCSLIHTFKTDYPYALEKELHERFASQRTSGEWFSLSDDDIAALKLADFSDFKPSVRVAIAPHPMHDYATTLQVAKIAQISLQSVRNWTRQYADLFSPEARGECADGVRYFSDKDIETMCSIANLRKNGVRTESVAEKIASNNDSSFGADGEVVPQDNAEATGTPDLTQVAWQVMDSRLQVIERRQEAQVQEALRRARWDGAMLASVIISTLLIVGMAVLS